MFGIVFLAVISVLVSRCQEVQDADLRGNDDVPKAINEGNAVNIESKNAEISFPDTGSPDRRKHIRAVTTTWTQRTPSIPTHDEDLTSEKKERFPRQAAEGPKKIVCYLNNEASKRRVIGRFTAENVDPFLCTHVIVSSAALDVDNNSINFPDKENLELLQRRKRFNPNLKIMLSVGGPQESSGSFSAVFGDGGERAAAFVQNVVKFLSNTSFDGIDINWQYSNDRTPVDREIYALVLKKFREEFDKIDKPRYVLSITLPILEEHIDNGYDLPPISSNVDFMSVLAYNYHDSWEPRVNHHAPIYYRQEENEYQYDNKLNVNHTISYLIEKGADATKLILGVPTFGRTYTLRNPSHTLIGAPADGPGEKGDITLQRGYLSYLEICRNINEGGWTIVNVKKSAMGPHAFNGYEWVSYDSMNSARLKARIANENGLGGLMFYTIDMDDFTGLCHNKTLFPIINAAKAEFLVGERRTPSIDAAKRGIPAGKKNHSCVTPRGEKGVCIKLRNCSTLFSSLRSSNTENIRYIEQSVCGTGRGASKVCCPSSTVSAAPPTPPTPRASAIGVERGNPDMCGKPTTTDVLFEDDGNVGTTRYSALGNWPWMVSIRYAYFYAAPQPRVSHICDGILISRRYVLAVASCLLSRPTRVHSVRLGDLNLDSDNDEASPVDVEVDEVIFHPQYASRPHVINNIALIRLNKSVEYTPTIRPVCLLNGLQYFTDDYYYKRNPFVVAWKRNGGQFSTYDSYHSVNPLEVATSAAEVTSPLLFETRDMVNISTCQQKYENLSMIIDQRFLCASRRTDNCQVDPEGPLLFMELNDKAEVTYHLGGFGVAPFGLECATTGFPEVYTRIATYIDWISKTTGLAF